MSENWGKQLRVLDGMDRPEGWDGATGESHSCSHVVVVGLDNAAM